MPKCFYCDREAVGVDSIKAPVCTTDPCESYLRHWSAPELQTTIENLFPKEDKD